MLGLTRNSRRLRRSTFSQALAPLEDRVLLAAIQVTTRSAPRGAVDVIFTGTADADTVFLSPDESRGVVANGGGTFRLNGALSEVSQLNLGEIRYVTFNLGGGDDRAVINDVPIFQVTINDGPTGQETNSYQIRSDSFDTTMGPITANFNSGVNSLSLHSGLGRTLTTDDVTVNATNTEQLSVGFYASRGGQVVVGGKLDVASIGSASRDDIVFFPQGILPGVDNRTGRIQITQGTRVSTGAGNDRFFAVANVDFRGTTSIVSAGGNDEVLFTSGGPNNSFETPAIRGTLNIATGDGQDTVSLASEDGFARIAATRAVTINTGNQSDMVDLRNVELRNTFTLTTGNNDPGTDALPDSVRLDQAEIYGTSRITTVGAGVVTLTGRGLLPTRFRSAAYFNLGSGVVNVGEPDSASRIVFSAAQIYTGVRSRITVRPRGLILQNLAQRRLVNAVDG
jgi:hypothetical protein